MMTITEKKYAAKRIEELAIEAQREIVSKSRRNPHQKEAAHLEGRLEHLTESGMEPRPLPAAQLRKVVQQGIKEFADNLGGYSARIDMTELITNEYAPELAALRKAKAVADKASEKWLVKYREAEDLITSRAKIARDEVMLGVAGALALEEFTAETSSILSRL